MPDVLNLAMSLFITQALNGLTLGVLLFLLAAGLTLVLGHHEFREPRARLALHDGRLFRGERLRVDRIVLARRR